MVPDTTTRRPRTTRATPEPCTPRPLETADPVPGRDISALQFTQSLLHMSRARIELRAAGLKARSSSPDDDVAWWEATVALNRTLRRRGAGSRAAMAAQLASQAVLAAATRAGLTLSPDITAVARSAAEVARMLAGGGLDTTSADYLARGWEDLLTPPADSPFPSGPAGGRGHRRAPARRLSRL